MSFERERAARERFRRLAWFLDDAVEIPILGWRVGFESLVGLIPGIGDVAGLVVASYLIFEAVRLRAPAWVIAHMGWNVLADTVLGMVPVAGDVFDFAFKANQKNLRLLEEHLEDPDRRRARSRGFLALLAGGMLALFLIVAVSGYLLFRWIWQLLFGPAAS